MRESRLQLFFLAIATLFHPIVETWIRPAGLTVDYPFLMLFWIALRRGPLTGALSGFALGLVRDLADYSLLGVSTLSYSVGAYAIGSVREKVDRENLLIRLVLLAIAYAFTRGLALFPGSDWSPLAAFLSWLRYSLPESLLCALVYLFILAFTRLLQEGARLMHEPGARR